MKVDVEWSDGDGVATVRHTEVAIEDEASVKAWQQSLVQQLQALYDEHGPIPLLVDISGVRIDPGVADAYGAVVKEHVIPLVTSVARYGDPALVHHFN